MPIRYVTEQQLSFTIPGHPYGAYAKRRDNLGKVNNRQRTYLNLKTYKSLIRMAVKQAAAENGWELTSEPLYFAIAVYYVPEGSVKKKLEETKGKYKDALINIGASLPRLSNIVISACKGIILRKGTQVCGMVACKKVAKEPRVEVLIGKPKTMQEMVYDLRNC